MMFVVTCSQSGFLRTRLTYICRHSYLLSCLGLSVVTSEGLPVYSCVHEHCQDNSRCTDLTGILQAST